MCETIYEVYERGNIWTHNKVTISVKSAEEP